jgi:recombinational DNA repair protein (RecF pathway)
MDDYETALPYVQRAADIAQRSLPEGHPHRQLYQESLDVIKLFIMMKNLGINPSDLQP